MARQEGILKFIGTVGGLSMYKTRDGFQARERRGVDANRVFSDPAFARTRENFAEFAQVAQRAKMLRLALRIALLDNADGKMHPRLVSAMFRVLRTDSVHGRGERLVATGDLELLKDFEFNINSPLVTTMMVPFTATLDRANGKMTVFLESFSPQKHIAQLPSATHCTLIAAGAAIDFGSGAFVYRDTSVEIVLGPQVEASRTLSLDFPAASNRPMFLTFGITFHQRVNGLDYPLKNGQYNAMQIVAVNKGGII